MMDELYDLHQDIHGLRMAHEESASAFLDALAQFVDSLKRHEATLEWAVSHIHTLESPEPQEKAMTRAEAIEKAEEHINAKIREIEQGGFTCEFRFVSHGLERRRVTVYPGLARQTTCVVINRARDCVTGVGRSWCSRDDEFSPIIGKLIALYRALGREVPAWLLHIPQE